MALTKTLELLSLESPREIAMVPTQSRYLLRPLKGFEGLVLLWLSYQIWEGQIAYLPHDSALSWVVGTALGWLGIRWIFRSLEPNPEFEKPAAA